jgi:hypothetical protein
MADYYPLLSKAVAGLDPNTPEARQAIYGRARMALTRQMASMETPVPQDVIDRELGALDGVVQRLEREAAGLEAEMPVEDKPEMALTTVQDIRAPSARPQVARKDQAKARRPLLAVGLSAGFVAVIAIATLAYLRRNEPPAMAQRPVATSAPSTTPSQVPAKTAERVQPGATEPTPPPAPVRAPSPVPVPAPAPVQAQVPVAAPAPTPAQPTTAVAPIPTPVVSAPAAQPQIAVANRMAVILEGKDEPQKVDVRQGAVVWRSEAVSGGQGQPLQQVVRAIADSPEARIRADITIQKNLDAAFPASHTVQVQFSSLGASELGAVQSLSQIEFRQIENQPGYQLAGQGITVMENVFLVALAKVEPAQSRNIAMMKARPLIYMEFQLVGGRRGAIILEKGVSGQQVFDEAFRNWQ